MKQLQVISCRKCPLRLGEHCCHEELELHTKAIVDIDIIPEWCPLPDVVTDNNKYSTTMEEKILDIITECKLGEITTNEATRQVLELSINWRSEQLICPKCGSINKRVHTLKTLSCDDCGEKWVF